MAAIMTPLERQRLRLPDAWVMFLVVTLAPVGVVISASARVFQEAVASGHPKGIVRSLAHLALALLAMVIVMIPDYRKLARPAVAWLLMGGVSTLLVVALFSPTVGNTHRWIRLPWFNLQPSELTKPILVLVLAAALDRATRENDPSGGLMRSLFLSGWLAGLVLVGRDLGTPLLLFVTTLAMLIAAGVSLRFLGVLAGGGTAIATVAILVERYRVLRVLGFIYGLSFKGNSWTKVPHQLKQSILAIGSGGLLGKGFGQSTQKAFFLPEVDNDFVFAVVCEELGLWGALLVLTAFLLLAWRGFHIAARARDPLGQLIALGATILLCGQALCHMGVVTGILPTKGLTLPFFSTGGSSLIGTGLLAGLLLNVSIRRAAHAE